MSQAKSKNLNSSALDFSKAEELGFFDQSVYQNGLVLSIVRADVARMVDATTNKPVLRNGKPVIFPVLVLDKVEDENGKNVTVPPSLVGEVGTDKAITIALSVFKSKRVYSDPLCIPASATVAAAGMSFSEIRDLKPGKYRLHVEEAVDLFKPRIFGAELPLASTEESKPHKTYSLTAI